jgi:UDP-N-acetylglucosamine/UDP-N-acetylgalactosamine diphosphorylase
MNGSSLLHRLQAADQAHVLRWWDELPDSRQASLAAQVAELDLPLISELWCAAARQSDGASAVTAPLEPPRDVISACLGERHPDAWTRAMERGARALRDGQVGAILVAGGQGTRLDFPQPKGMFPIAPVSGKSLYQWLAEQLLARSRQCEAVIPWYVMTSDSTHAETEAFFEENRYFGLAPEDVHFFRQGNLPAVDRATGRILMSAKDELCLSPDGHGGLLSALDRAGLFDDMRERGVQHLFYHQVDNPLVRMCDPAFLGFHLLRDSEVSTKVVRKTDPHEKVGLVVEQAGQTRIVEYSDLPADLAAHRDAAGDLCFWAGNTAVHLFERGFLERLTREGGLPLHTAVKRVPHLGPDGEWVRPETDNALKFERFIFDVLPAAQRTLVMECRREHEFAPLKNREGLYSPEYVRSAMCREFTRWLRASGLTLADELPVEIGPLIALDEHEFAERMGRAGGVSPLIAGTLKQF